MNVQDTGERRVAVTITAALLACVLWPLRQYRRPRAERRDGFPLSHYPMFTVRRPAKTTVYYLVAETREGDRHYLAHQQVGPGGLNQVRRQVNRRVAEGGAGTLARQVAERITAHGGPGMIARVHVVRGRFNLDRCFEQRRVAGSERILATAEVQATPLMKTMGPVGARPRGQA